MHRIIMVTVFLPFVVLAGAQNTQCTKKKYTTNLNIDITTEKKTIINGEVWPYGDTGATLTCGGEK